MSDPLDKDFDAIQALLTSRVLPLDEMSFLRLVHGRGGSIEAARQWHIDQLGDVILVVAYEEVPWQVEGLECLSAWADVNGFSAVWMQSRFKHRAPMSVVWGHPSGVPESMHVHENGLTYELRFANQNIGLFPDMATGRDWVRSHSSGARVLNLFAYTCGFSVAAVAGGAEHVVNMDMSKSSLAWGRCNHELNAHEKTRVQYFSHDVMKSFGKITRLAPFDVIVIDPPSYQRGHFEAKKDYCRLLKRVAPWLSPDGRVLCCLNDPFLTHSDLVNWIAEDSGLCVQDTLPVTSGTVSDDQVQALKMIVAGSGA